MISIFGKSKKINNFVESTVIGIESGVLKNDKFVHNIKHLKLNNKQTSSTKNKIISQVVKTVMADYVIDNKEVEVLKNLMSYFDLTCLEKYGLSKESERWAKVRNQICEGAIPIIDITGLDFILKKDEVIHWLDSAGLVKLKKTIVKYSYSGPTMRIKIAKGIHWRVGSIKVAPTYNENWVTESKGMLYLTNQRLVFKAEKKSFQFKLDKLFSMDYVDNNFLSIQKEGRSNPFILDLVMPDIMIKAISNKINENEAVEKSA